MGKPGTTLQEVVPGFPMRPRRQCSKDLHMARYWLT